MSWLGKLSTLSLTLSGLSSRKRSFFPERYWICTFWVCVSMLARVRFSMPWLCLRFLMTTFRFLDTHFLHCCFWHVMGMKTS